MNQDVFHAACAAMIFIAVCLFGIALINLYPL